MTEFTHEMEIIGAVEAVFPLFTPIGEEAWVPDWNPTYLTKGKDTREEMLFTTGDGNEKTYWTCLKWQPKVHHARYLRITPASRIAIVDVRCTAKSAACTKVRVSYTLTPLIKNGEAKIDRVTAQSFAASIDEWADLIHAHLSN